jgi:hypothetical protein
MLLWLHALLSVLLPPPGPVWPDPLGPDDGHGVPPPPPR